MRSLRTGLLFWRGNLSRFCVILTPVTDVTGVRETVKKGLCPFLTKGLQPAARTTCTPLAYKSHTCSLSCIFCQVQEVNCPEGARETTLGCAPTENDQNPFAACGRQTLRGFFDMLSHASDRCHRRENPPVERYCVSICAQIPTDFRTKHGRKSFRCPIQRGISTALRPLFVTERNRRSRLLARSSVRYSSACASCLPALCRIFILKFLFAEAAKVPSLTYSREPCILC